MPDPDEQTEGTVAIVETLRPEDQAKYKRGAWWTALTKLRSLAGSGGED